MTAQPRQSSGMLHLATLCPPRDGAVPGQAAQRPATRIAAEAPRFYSFRQKTSKARVNTYLAATRPTLKQIIRYFGH